MNFLQRGTTLLIILAFGLLSSSLFAQVSAKDGLALARKKARATKGMSKEEKTQCRQEALVLFGKVVEDFPDASDEVATARYEMARIEYRLGHFSAALKQLTKIQSESGPPRIRARALALTAKVEKKQGRYDQADAAWDRLITDHPGEARLVAQARLDRAKLMAKQKSWRSAREAAEGVFVHHPEIWRLNVDAADFIVSLYTKRRDWVAAIAKLEELDADLNKRFSSSEVSAKVAKAMAKMSARRALTALPE